MSSNILEYITNVLKDNIWCEKIDFLHQDITSVILKDSDRTKFMCKICKAHNSRQKPIFLRNLLGHLVTSTHEDNMKKEKLQEMFTIIARKLDGKSYNEDVAPPTQNPKTLSSIPPEKPLILNSLLLKFEITQFILANRLNYSISNNLLNFGTKMAKYSEEIRSECFLSREIISDVASKGIGAVLRERVVHRLRISPFSIMVDKGSDRYTTGFFTVCVKYIKNITDKEPIVEFYRMIQLGETGTALELYNLIVQKALNNDPLLLANIVGITTDQEPVMVGSHNGLTTRMIDEYRYVYAFDDPCHIYNTICNYSLKAIDSTVVTMITYICSHFKRSILNKAILERIQRQNGKNAYLGVVHYTKNRWTSLTDSIERIIKIWEDLKLYFDEIKDEEGLAYFTPVRRCYFSALFIFLSRLTHYNKYFQAEVLNYSQVLSTIRESFMVFAKEVCIPKYTDESFDTLSRLDYKFPDAEDQKLLEQKKKEDPQNARPDRIHEENENKDEKRVYDTIYLEQFQLVLVQNDIELGKLIKEVGFESLNAMFTDLYSFILAILHQMKTRLPYNDDILIQSQVVFLELNSTEYWKALGEKFSNIIKPEDLVHFINDVKRFSVNYQGTKRQHETSQRSFVETWTFLSPTYPYVAKLALAILVLPHSSASVERIFSKMQDVKTDKRNRLSTENLEVSLLIQEAYNDPDFVIENEMLQKFEEFSVKKKEINKIQPSKPTLIEEEKTTHETKKDKVYRLIEIESDTEPEGTRKKVIFKSQNKKENEEVSINNQANDLKNKKINTDTVNKNTKPGLVYLSMEEDEDKE